MRESEAMVPPPFGRSLFLFCFFAPVGVPSLRGAKSSTILKVFWHWTQKSSTVPGVFRSKCRVRASPCLKRQEKKDE